jgi:trans-aconitate 2-methyltransferase
LQDAPLPAPALQDVWQPQDYQQFAAHRTRAAADLIGRIAGHQPARIVDLGCGTGSVTRLLAAQWPRAQISAVDSSSRMLAEARRTPSPVTWVEADINRWSPDTPFDLVFSNTALQWVDDHADLLLRLVGWLAPGGMLAVQMPRNFEEPSHTAIAEAIDAGPWAARLKPLLRLRPVARPEAYAGWLLPVTSGLDIWETTYLQIFEGEDPVLAWAAGAALRPLLAALDTAEREAFLAEYASRLRRVYPMRSDGKTLFPFRRLFIVARR